MYRLSYNPELWLSGVQQVRQDRMNLCPGSSYFMIFVLCPSGNAKVLSLVLGRQLSELDITPA